MKFFLVSLLFIFSSNTFAADWCPRYEDKNPVLWADVGPYQFFYFTNEFFGDSQVGSLIVSNQKYEIVMTIPHADAFNDWFSSFSVESKTAAFYLDSHSYSFDSAWIKLNGKTLRFKTGTGGKPNCL